VTRPASDKSAAAPAPSSVSPLQPRRGLLIVTSVVFAIWVGAMIAMYVTTVYPQRHPSHATTTKT
jgi:hypothetical protein